MGPLKIQQLRRFYDALDAWARGTGPLTDASALYAADMKTLPRVLTMIGVCDINNYPCDGLTTQDIISLMFLYHTGLQNHRLTRIESHLQVDPAWNPAKDENTL